MAPLRITLGLGAATIVAMIFMTIFFQAQIYIVSRSMPSSLHEVTFVNHTERPERERIKEALLESDSRPQEVSKVLLVTYHRGGSSFLGELFNQNPSAFYWFEPLNYQHHYLAGQFNIDPEQFFFTYNGTGTALPEEIINSFTSTLVDIFNCNFQRVDINILTHYFITQWKKVNKAMTFINCLESHQYFEAGPGARDDSVVYKCVPWLTEACLTSNIRAIKSIRMPAFMTERLLTRDPSIKVIYYTRDVRAITVSRAQSGVLDLAKLDEVLIQAKKQCAWSRHDIEGYRRINQLHLFVLHLRYEDFAREPFPLSNKVYKFLHRRMPDCVLRWLMENTNSKSDNGPLGTSRNSTATVDKWRDNLPRPASQVITEQCQDVLSNQGYS